MFNNTPALNQLPNYGNLSFQDIKAIPVGISGLFSGAKLPSAELISSNSVFQNCTFSDNQAPVGNFYPGQQIMPQMQYLQQQPLQQLHMQTHPAAAFSVWNSQQQISFQGQTPANGFTLNTSLPNQFSIVPSSTLLNPVYPQLNYSNSLINPIQIVGQLPIFNFQPQSQTILSGPSTIQGQLAQPSNNNSQSINFSSHSFVQLPSIEKLLKKESDTEGILNNGTRPSQKTSQSLSTGPYQTCTDLYNRQDRIDSLPTNGTLADEQQQNSPASLAFSKIIITKKNESALNLKVEGNDKFNAAQGLSDLNTKNITEKLKSFDQNSPGIDKHDSIEAEPQNLNSNIQKITRSRCRALNIIPETYLTRVPKNIKSESKKTKSNNLEIEQSSPFNSIEDKLQNKSQEDSPIKEPQVIYYDGEIPEKKKNDRYQLSIEQAKLEEERIKKELIDSLDPSQVQILKDSIQLNRQNINRNLIKQFKIFVDTQITYTLGYEQEDTHKYHFKSCQQSRVIRTEHPTGVQKVFFAKKFNKFIATKHHSNADIKQIIKNKIYGYLFREFLSTAASDWIEANGKEKKADYETILKFYMLCLENNDYLLFLNDTFSLNRRNIFYFEKLHSLSIQQQDPPNEEANNYQKETKIINQITSQSEETSPKVKDCISELD